MFNIRNNPNWFVGIPVPADGWFEEIVTGFPAGFRRCCADDLHITIAFFGSAGERNALSGWAALRFPLPPLTVRLGSAIAMGPKTRYSALSIELIRTPSAEELERTIGLHRDVACSAAGAVLDRRPPKPHVTIALPTRHANDDDLIAGVRWASALDFQRREVPLDTIALYTRAKDPRLRRFTIVAQSKLPQAVTKPYA